MRSGKIDVLDEARLHRQTKVAACLFGIDRVGLDATGIVAETAEDVDELSAATPDIEDGTVWCQEFPELAISRQRPEAGAVDLRQRPDARALVVLPVVA